VLAFHTHKSGRKVYHVFKDGEPGITRSFIFSFADDGDEFGGATFDVRRLPTFTGTGAVVTAPGVYPFATESEAIHAAIEAAIDQGYLP
jgi:hypothetical protein